MFEIYHAPRHAYDWVRLRGHVLFSPSWTKDKQHNKIAIAHTYNHNLCTARFFVCSCGKYTEELPDFLKKEVKEYLCLKQN